MKFTIPITERAKKLVDEMDINSLLCQITCPQFFSHTPLPKQHNFGALFFHAANKDDLKTSIKKFKSQCSFPPLITTDMESGPGEMIKDGTQFPSIMAAGIAGDEQLAYDMGRAAAHEGRAVGYNWSLSPCVDIAAVADSPMVSLRSAAQDADTVIKIAGAYMRGLQESGMVATLKHFPGDGFDIYDQHLTVPINPQTREEWFQTSGKVFKELIDQGAMAIMPGHIALPAFDNKWKDTDYYPPASISKPLLGDLLRGELGFDGLIVSDAVNMGGFAGFINRFDAAALFLEAGGDCVLFPNLDYFHTEMKIRLENGMLKKETLVARACRIVSLKDKLGLLDRDTQPPTDINYEKHEATSRAIVDKCVRVIRDRENLLPTNITKDTRIGHVIISMRYDDEKTLFAELTTELGKYSDSVDELICEAPEEIFDRVYQGDFDLIVCSISARHDYGTNIARLAGPKARLMMGGWMRLGTPTVFISHFHPFIEKEYFYSTDTIINTYGSTKYTMKRLVQGIIGKQPFEK
ncbi:MAG: hypothetical protein JXX29_24060 [Deltaproteobacteria bacterium]|nr:hypothetical protein [Deltaproteobacteria bacterium]MBN2674778.1 hypothetical protein [Deltaproteobacteria bacterium]